jgi:hypothetical protein
MKNQSVVTIIPSVGRKTLNESIKSVVNESLNCIPIVEVGGKQGYNRNVGIKKARILCADWISFLDDDDYYNHGWSDELYNKYNDCDIVILRMVQNGIHIPDVTNRLVYGNVGINFALNMNRIDWDDLPEFDDNEEGEDWRFLYKLITKYPNISVTDNIFYVANNRNYNLVTPLNKYTDWIPVIHDNLDKYNMKIIELGCGDGTRYLVDKFNEVISIEFSRYEYEYLVKSPNHTFIKLDPLINTIEKDDVLISTHGHNRPDFTSEVNLLMNEIKKHNADVIFVDFGFHFRGEVVNALIEWGGIKTIVYHDTNFPYYGYKSIYTNSNGTSYDMITNSNGQGTTILKIN